MFVILSEAKNPSSIEPRAKTKQERFFAPLRMTTFRLFARGCRLCGAVTAKPTRRGETGITEKPAAASCYIHAPKRILSLTG